MDAVPRCIRAVVDKEIYRFGAQTVHVGIVSRATEFTEQTYRREYCEIYVLCDIAEGACLSSFFFAHDNTLL